MSQIRFAQLQHPVGQGGFHTGWLFESAFPIRIDPLQGTPSFVWAYDCGSDQLSILRREIKKIRGAPINVLFLSHLDDDHVVGVDKLLLAASHVDEVVLPYLNDDEWALHLASGASSGSLSGSFIDLVSDPAIWFGSRGVDRITYVESGDEDGEGPAAPDRIYPIDPDGRPEAVETDTGKRKPVKVGWTRSTKAEDSDGDGGDGGDGASSARAEVQIAPAGSVASIHGADGIINWVLSPFAFRPPTSKLASFKAMLISKFGSGLTAKAYADAARTDAGRKDLRICYDAVWKTHNLHSMALYAGPAVPALGKIPNTSWHGNFLRRVVQPGWVSTGDFDMTVKKRRDRFIQFYAVYASMVGQLSLPHHGSDLSFHETILAAFPDLSFAIASVGANGHGHPGLQVQAAVEAAIGAGFVRVDESASSSFEIQGTVSR
jgi:hypothetical protein